MLLEETTTVDAEETFQDIEVAILPVGSTEQHGPALPLSTDTKSAETVASGVAGRSDTVVLPSIPIGVSPHHRQFYGSLWVSAETFEQYIYETLANITEHGIRKAIIVNGHGGNTAAIERVSQTLYREEIAFVVPWNWWDGVGQTPYEVIDETVEIPGHAGGFEASVMLYIASQLVHEDRFEEAADKANSDSRFSHPYVRGFDFVDWTGNGVQGDPQLASAEAGEALYEASLESLEELLDWLVALPDNDCFPQPHK